MKWLLLLYSFISLWIYSDAQSCELEGVTSTQWLLAYENEPVDDTERTLFKRFNSAFITGVTVTAGDTNYFDVSFDADNNILELKPSANFARYEELTASTIQPIIGVNLLFACTVGSNDLRFNQPINDVNNNDPVFNSSLFSYNLPMPFPRNIEVTSFGVEIQAVDIDITNTQVTFSIEPAGDFTITYDGLVGNLNKVHRARIFALRPLRLTEPTFYTLRVTDMGAPQISTTSQLEITVDEEASLKQSPVFGEAFYIAEYAADATNKVDASLDVDLHGSTASSATISGDHSELFECTASGSAVNVRLVGSLPEEVLLEKTFIALTVEVTVDDAEYTARTALIVSIPQPETTTTACPTETTMTTAACPEIPTTTECAECVCTTTESTPCPETTTATECVCTTTEIMPCPETTTQPECVCTTPEVEPCPETTETTACVCSTTPEVTTSCPETTTSTECDCETTVCPSTTTVEIVTCPETTATTECTCPTTTETTTTETCEPCDCTSTATTLCPETTTSDTTPCAETPPTTECNCPTTDTTTTAEVCLPCPETTTECITSTGSSLGTTTTECPIQDCSTCETTTTDCSTATPTTTTTTMTTAPSDTVTPEFTTTECPALDCSLCTTTSSLTTVTTGTPPNVGNLRFDEELYTFRLSPTHDIDYTFQAISDVPEEIIYDLTNTEGPLPTALSFNRITGQLTNNGFLSSGLYQLVIMATGQETENTATAPVIISVGSAEVCKDGSVRTSYAFKLTSIAENTEGVVLFKGAREDLADYNFCIEHHYPQQTGAFHINEETGNVEARAVDRESSIFAGMDPAQFTITLQLNYGPVTQNCPITTMSSVQFAYTSSNNNTRATDSRQCVHMDSEIFNEPQKTILAVLVLDENDNDPVFETYEMTAGYPKNSLSSRISTPQIIRVEATDADIGINAAINYFVENNDRVIIHPLTGVIYPSDQIYSEDEDFEITVIARDQNGAGRSSQPLHVLIRFLDESHISILTITDVLLEDMDTRLAQIETNTSIRIRALTASVLPNSEVTRKGRTGGVTYLRVTGYALDQNDELVVTTQLQEVLENVQGLQVQALPDDDGEVPQPPTVDDEESLTGWIVAVSVLSVLLALIIIAFILAYIFLFRKNKKYSNMDENESTPPSTTPTATPQFQKNSKLEINESKVGVDVSERRSTGYIFGQSGGGDTGESDTDESKETRKSVSFNTNVERIDIERETENDSQAKTKQDPSSNSASAVKKDDEPEIEVHRL